MNDALEIIGSAPAVEHLRQQIALAARSDAKVLITGESGVGKELVSRLVHAGSRRASHPLVAVNCGAIADTLLETELFGHVRGSFSGAHRDRAGLFERAHRGTVFMDEVGETSPRMQGLLLRFLETGELQPVGSDRVQTKVDVRIISATNRVLVDRVAAGTFREDLYYRLNVLTLRVPALRERREDVPLLLQYFLRHFAQEYRTEVPEFSPEALAAFIDHEWPGNVRELKNVVERIVISRHGGRVRPEDLTVDLPAAPRRVSDAAPPLPERLYRQIVVERQSFWTVAYAPFVARDLTRADLRALVALGLAQAGGDYRALVSLFNMPAEDHRRFTTMLRKYHCYVMPQPFKSAGSREKAPYREDRRGKTVPS